MLRRLSPIQPDSFEFTPANLEWARAQTTKYPEGRQQSAIIPVLWRAQEQEGWLSRPAIEYCADLLGMPYIRALEVATFYFMFQLHPVGSVAHIQICGTTTCMICGAEDLIRVCREKISPHAHTLSADGKFSWEEVECLGACSNAPMAQIGKDYYEDLTVEKLSALIDALGAGKVPVPGPQNGRFSSEAKGGPTALTDLAPPAKPNNASVTLALDLGDTVKRIDGTEVPILTPWVKNGGAGEEAAASTPAEKPSEPQQDQASDDKAASPAQAEPAAEQAAPGRRPAGLDQAREGGPDDLKEISGVGPVLEKLLHSLGFYHFDQVAKWDDAEIAWVDENLEGFKGRVTRDDWVGQARKIIENREGKSS
ncbi:NADH-quinone oxidoreductase subunit NuoE [Paracoccus sp. SCSIO 75233]|uniref:NADH-quinone oxidoreductase subunit NuoE n=1 Tax=Paracoccus sp. SCSIO 75233 TaxID=3017782 RepID=UPI0022F09C4B|nr:NADH-quinone oxidoreductase subunit NuoE [Paracoccus sp. SCSIO 75233]WBU53665.1 NADH-quinone oxidoreductase subunit NuoE [Paracoccus sp. SCSIO 75233]